VTAVAVDATGTFCVRRLPRPSLSTATQLPADAHDIASIPEPALVPVTPVAVPQVPFTSLAMNPRPFTVPANETLIEPSRTKLRVACRIRDGSGWPGAGSPAIRGGRGGVRLAEG
jgi:hypothetical protein